MRPVTLYVVDEYLLTRIAYKRYFASDDNYNIVGDFSSAKECLAQMEIQTADIIIIDIELSDMNGIEAIKLIKEKYPKTKVIISTSNKNEQSVLAALACGACAYVLKGEKEIDLKKVISSVLEGQLWIDLEVAKHAFSAMPALRTYNLENLYEYKRLKSSLTARELEVLKLLIDGKTNSEIADEIIVSTNTAKAHVGSILTKLAVTDRVQAAVKAVRANLF